MENKEEFDIISNNITKDSRLTDSGYRLITLMINDINEMEIKTTHFGNLLGWSPKKLSNATNNLIELGYIKRVKKNNGNKGFKYHYEFTFN